MGLLIASLPARVARVANQAEVATALILIPPTTLEVIFHSGNIRNVKPGIYLRRFPGASIAIIVSSIEAKLSRRSRLVEKQHRKPLRVDRTSPYHSRSRCSEISSQISGAKVRHRAIVTLDCGHLFPVIFSNRSFGFAPSLTSRIAIASLP